MKKHSIKPDHLKNTTTPICMLKTFQACKEPVIKSRGTTPKHNQGMNEKSLERKKISLKSIKEKKLMTI